VIRFVITLMLLSFGSAVASDVEPFATSEKNIPAGHEWNKEIVARVSGSIKCVITSKDSIAVTLIADRSFQAARKGDSKGMVRKDLLLTTDHPDGRFEDTIEIKSPGSYWFIVENRSRLKQRVSLKCYKSEEGV